MGRSQLGLMGDAAAAVALLAVVASIVTSLARSGPLRRNRLDLAAALVFVACGLGQAADLLASGGGRADSWVPPLWDALTALVALSYLWLRRHAGTPEDGSALYGDLRRRKHELAGQVMAANVREDLSTERAAAAEQRLARVFTSASAGMAVVDRRGRITRANPSLCRISGRDPSSIPDSLAAELVTSGDRPAVQALIRQGGDPGQVIDLKIERPDEEEVWGRLTVTSLAEDEGLLLVQVDDVTGLRQAEERLEHLAMHDPVTGLANRHLFHIQASAALRHANRTGRYVGCLFVDLDHFKVVNDSLGHNAGDRVLTTMASRLVDAVRPEDAVARMGGDDFCVLLVALEHQAEAEAVARRVRSALDGFVDIEGTRVATSVSMGVAVALPGDRTTSETLVRDADTALCRAKADDSGRTVVFQAELREDALRQLQMEPR